MSYISLSPGCLNDFSREYLPNLKTLSKLVIGPVNFDEISINSFSKAIESSTISNLYLLMGKMEDETQKILIKKLTNFINLKRLALENLLLSCTKSLLEIIHKTNLKCLKVDIMNNLRKDEAVGISFDCIAESSLESFAFGFEFSTLESLETIVKGLIVLPREDPNSKFRLKELILATPCIPNPFDFCAKVMRKYPEVRVIMCPKPWEFMFNKENIYV